MRRTAAVLLAALFCITLLAGCAKKQTYQDGTYLAEFKGFDSRGYKDTLTLTVRYGTVTEVVYDAVNEEGALKSKDEKLKSEMEKVQGTYPAKVSTDLANQYLDVQDLSKVDVVAGATYSSECFVALFEALEPQMYEGDTTLLLVDNVPDK